MRLLMISATLIGLVAGCRDVPDLAPKVYQVTSGKTVREMANCIDRDRAKHFPGLTYASLSRVPPGQVAMYVAEGGTAVTVQAEIGKPNAIMVRSDTPVSEAQKNFLRACAGSTA